MCGLCDNLGIIDAPGGGRKKCPECYSEPPWYLRMSMASMLFGPGGPAEDDDMSEIQERRLRRQREEEADYLRRHLAGLVAGDPPEERMS